MSDPVAAAAVAGIQGVLVLAVAPLTDGIMRRTKARLQRRRGPRLFQPYRDLVKMWSKETVESTVTSPVARWAPAFVLAFTLGATLLVPTVSVLTPLGGAGDLLVVAGLLAGVRFALALAALDTGSAFGGIGSSREVAVAALVEPGLVLALTAAAIAAGTTDLGAIAAHGTASGVAVFDPVRLLAAAAFAIAVVAETGHEPIDNPDTHLELTMIHEGMLLEASGRRLALLVYAAQLKTVLFIVLFAAAFLPVGLAAEPAPVALAIGAAVAVLKVAGASVALAALDASVAKVRVLALPGLLGLSSLLALSALAARVWLPG